MYEALTGRGLLRRARHPGDVADAGREPHAQSAARALEPEAFCFARIERGEPARFVATLRPIDAITPAIGGVAQDGA